MKTLYQLNEFGSSEEDAQVALERIEGEADRCKNTGDLLGRGDWIASKVVYLDNEEDVESAFIEMISSWASAVAIRHVPASSAEFLAIIGQYPRDQVAIAFARASLCLLYSDKSLPDFAQKLAYHLSDSIADIFQLTEHKPKDLPHAAAHRLDDRVRHLLTAIDSFCETSAASLINAKEVSILVTKASRVLKSVLLLPERKQLTDLELVLGSAFRQFCEASNRRDTPGLLKLAEQVDEIAERFTAARDSVLWMHAVRPVCQHVIKLTSEAVHRGWKETIPSLHLFTKRLKVDLATTDRELTFSCRLNNEGDGHANHVALSPIELPDGVAFVLTEPRGPFDVAAKSNQVLKFALRVAKPLNTLSVPLEWKCSTIAGEQHTDADVLHLEQQSAQPDWQAIEDDPPYSLRPVRNFDRLFGRGTILTELIQNAGQGKSTFVWGQKRVGKTSLLQVLVEQLKKRKKYAAIFLRMGELKAMHEGQIARTIAERLCQETSIDQKLLPGGEETYGLSLGPLIPIVRKLCGARPETRFVCVIDEFDDFDSTFYTGERGKQFIKALRSLSEEGLTFFFAGSERMNGIYVRHQSELNVWANVHVDRIESWEDCKELVTRPVQGAIEYQPECVDALIQYCDRNPFVIDYRSSQELIG